MLGAPLAVPLAVATPVVVSTALCRQVLLLRAMRRELDGYLRWLLEETAGPVSVAPPPRWR